jgi:hypothetical protein
LKGTITMATTFRVGPDDNDKFANNQNNGSIQMQILPAENDRGVSSVLSRGQRSKHQSDKEEEEMVPVWKDTIDDDSSSTTSAPNPDGSSRLPPSGSANYNSSRNGNANSSSGKNKIFQPFVKLYDFLGGPEPFRPPKIARFPYIGALDRKIHRSIVRIPILIRIIALILFMTAWIAGFAILVRQSLFDAMTSLGPPSYISRAVSSQ